ncbi:MAG: 2Fe-2S iron-sulfur cluster-binding protein [Capsulimonadaceae bacterium]|nr:2Fe-2S iron-sulfur cluster-binding protein [Capsulimonadaceae bacterium]
MATFTIDNQVVTVADGATVLDGARALGIDIPALCAAEARPAHPTCFVCVVRIDGSGRLVPACATTAVDGMRVESETDDVRDARRTAIELLLSDHFGDCIAPCSLSCLAHIDAPRMIRRIAERRFGDAIAVVKETVPLPAALGRICPELCEKACRRHSYDAAVSICALERFVADWDLSRQEPYNPVCAPPTGRTVAIAGAGPAGLAAAYFLQIAGHACTLFDDHPKPGGMLRYGVPEAVLPRDVLDAEIAAILRTGAQIRCGVGLGRDISLGDLRARFDAVLLTVGDLRTSSALDEALIVGSDGISAARETLATSLPGVFAAGAAVAPMRHAVRAVASGRRAAASIDRFLGGAGSFAAAQEYSVRSGKIENEELLALAAGASPEARIASRKPLTEDEAVREAKRCLQCECQGAATCKLRDAARRCAARAGRFRGTRRPPARDESHPEVVFDAGKCIACGICVRIAAAAGEETGVSFQGRGFGIRVASSTSGSLADGLRRTARECALACPTGALTLKEGL